MKRLDQLTFTRFAMVLLVLFYHGTSGFYTKYLDFFPLTSLIYSAPTAVSYLYVLSGFVMSLVYYQPDKKFDVFGYWRARFIRIYPLYIISFALMCVYYYEDLFRIKPQKILANIFVVQAWFPAYSQSFNYASWSLTVEFFFYAIFPLLMIWAYRQSTRKLIWVSVVVWIVNQLLNFALWIGFFPAQKGLIVYFPPFHLSSFLMGVIGGIWFLREGRQQAVKPRMVYFFLGLSFLLAAGYTILSSSIVTTLPHNLQPMLGLLSPILLLFIVSLALDESRLSKFLNHKVLVNLGEASYAIYILHVPVVWLYERFLDTVAGIDPVAVLQVSFLPMMITLGLVAHFVDIPLRRWLKAFLTRLSMRLLILDIAILTLSAFVIFHLRFGNGREYESYREMERFVFWVAFFVRILLAIFFGTLNPLNVNRSAVFLLRQVFLSVSIGSVIIVGAVFVGYSTGWFENFPRSVFLYDWLIVLALSLLVRFGFRVMKIYKPDLLPA